MDRSRPAPASLGRALRQIRQRIPAGTKGDLDLRDLIRALGRGWSDEASAPLELERARTLRKAALAKLAQVERYAGARACRRKVLLGYFGEEDATDRCENCDRCLRANDPVLRQIGRNPRSQRAAGIFAALLGRSGLG